MDKNCFETQKHVVGVNLLNSPQFYFTREDLQWLIAQAEKLDEIKGLINDERLTKNETVDKISKIVNV